VTRRGFFHDPFDDHGCDRNSLRHELVSLQGAGLFVTNSVIIERRRCVVRSWVGLGQIRVSWAGQGWVALGWAGLLWTGLVWIGLGWTGLDSLLDFPAQGHICRTPTTAPCWKQLESGIEKLLFPGL